MKLDDSVQQLPPDMDWDTRPANDVRADEHGVDWRDRVCRGKDGRPLATVANVMTMLRYHPEWRGVLAYDMFADAVVKMKPPPWDHYDMPADKTLLRGEWIDDDSTRTKAWLERKEAMQVGIDTVDKSVSTVAATAAHHPVRDYLNSLKWDGEPRLANMLHTYFGVDKSEYACGIGKRWMISAVARVMEPGCQVDCVLILEGPQGIGKSTGMRYLVGEWYSDTGINIGDKDSYQNLRNVWVYGLDELDSLKRSEITKTKTFISSRVDRYRPSFGRRARDFPRQCVFVGSTNESEYLADSTGNRRFWPVKVKRAIDTGGIMRDRDQLWAEAVVCYKAGQAWHIDTDELRRLCEEQQEERIQSDPWEEKIADWLKTPRHWDSYRPFEIDAKGVVVSDILTHALGKKADAMTKFDHIRVGQILRTLGYVRDTQKRIDGQRVRPFVKCHLSPTSP